MDPVSKVLDQFQERLKFRRWFFGHFHTENDLILSNRIGFYHCLYDLRYGLLNVENNELLYQYFNNNKVA